MSRSSPSGSPAGGARRSVAGIVAVRHGESTANAAFARAAAAGVPVTELPDPPALPARDGDVPLTERGRAESAALRGVLHRYFGPAGPGLVLCSPYLRARETARIALGAPPHGPHGPPGIRVDARLRDRGTGVLELLDDASVRARHPAEYARRAEADPYTYRPPGGESMADVTRRVRALLAARLGWSGVPLAPTGPLGTVRALLFTHDAVILALHRIIEGALPGGAAPEGVHIGTGSVTVWTAQSEEPPRPAPPGESPRPSPAGPDPGPELRAAVVRLRRAGPP